MTRPRRGWAALLALLALVAAGCVYYPTVFDAGGVRLHPRHGRAVRQADRAEVYLELASTGKYGDVLTGVLAPVAGRAELVGPGGAPVARLEIPGETVLRFGPGGYRVVLADLKRPLAPGETFIVTLLFEKSGGIGVITVVE